MPVCLILETLPFLRGGKGYHYRMFPYLSYKNESFECVTWKWSGSHLPTCIEVLGTVEVILESSDGLKKINEHC